MSPSFQSQSVSLAQSHISVTSGRDCLAKDEASPDERARPDSRAAEPTGIVLEMVLEDISHTRHLPMRGLVLI